MAEHTTPQPGGFIIPAAASLPSPSPSSASSRAPAAAALPHPRARSLAPGSSKEGMVRRYVEDRLLNTSRRYVKKFAAPTARDEVVGYRSFGEVCRDLGGVVNVLWLSGTPSMQIPFLLKVASDFTQYVRSFPPSPKPSFELLGKLDHCFSSLLSGQDVDTGETLPGFENGLRAGMTVTDMVRCRSLVEQTRVLMVEVLSSDAEAEEDEEEEDEEGDEDTGASEAEADFSSVGNAGFGRSRWDIEDDDRLHLDAARIYENTIVHLGSRLGDPLGNNSTQDPASQSGT